MAVFTLDNGRTRTVHFGAAGASDYTQHRDPVRKQQYLARHAPREDWDNPIAELRLENCMAPSRGRPTE